MTVQEIIQALEKQGLTIYRIAHDTDIPEETVRNWGKGRTKPFKSNGNVKVLEEYYKKMKEVL